MVWRVRVLATCAVLPPLLSFVSLARIASAVRGRSGRAPGAAPDDAVLAEYVGQILHRLPPPWRYTCLRRSVVLYHLLCRAGRPVALRIGVRKEAGSALEAHAWLVKDGVPYLEWDPAHSATYTEIASFAAPGVP
jgi:hypothetical protein